MPVGLGANRVTTVMGGQSHRGVGIKGRAWYQADAGHASRSARTKATLLVKSMASLDYRARCADQAAELHLHDASSVAVRRRPVPPALAMSRPRAPCRGRDGSTCPVARGPPARAARFSGR